MEDMMRFEFDEDLFLENYYPDYFHSDEVAELGDIAKVLDDDYEDDDECVQEYLNTPKEELQREYDELMRSLLEKAFENYLNTNYPQK